MRPPERFSSEVPTGRWIVEEELPNANSPHGACIPVEGQAVAIEAQRLAAEKGWKAIVYPEYHEPAVIDPRAVVEMFWQAEGGDL